MIGSELRNDSSVDVLGMRLNKLSAAGLLAHIEQDASRGKGGWVVTVNLDILQRHHSDPLARQVYDAATLRIADGMPIVWASKIQGQPLPERVAGSSFMYQLCEMCSRNAWGVYLLGGTPGTAEAAAPILEGLYPGLKLTARSDVNFDAIPTEAQLIGASELLSEKLPKVVLVGLGSPKQEHLISRLHTRFPDVWFVGVGGSFAFVAGTLQRAPSWIQALGLEWAHRLAQEPRRLAKRYLGDNLPFFGQLLLSSVRKRFQ